MSGGWFLNGHAPVAVEVGECLCPGTPHTAGDTVWLRPELSGSAGFAVTVAMQGDQSGFAERVGAAYMAAGIVRWTFADDAGKPVPCTVENIASLRWNEAVRQIAERASDLYGEQVLGPLVRAAEAEAAKAALTIESSLSGPTDHLTSAKRSSSRSRQKP